MNSFTHTPPDSYGDESTSDAAAHGSGGAAPPEQIGFEVSRHANQVPIGGTRRGDDTEHYRVLDTELADKQGNYIFTIGDVGCGKSTMQNLMIARMWDLESIHLDYTSKSGDPRHDKLLNDWVVSIKSGRVPGRTDKGKLQEFSIRISQPKRKELELNFLEISGEDIKSIVPTLNLKKRPKINDQLVEYLRAKRSRINKRFIFVSDCEQAKKNAASQEPPEFTEDILFNALLRYLLGKDGLAMERISVLFVAAKWDAVGSEYRSLAHYFKRQFPQTRAVLQSGRCNANYIAFSVGRIEEQCVAEDPQGNKTYEGRITALEHKYVDVLIQWIYHSFTGNHLQGLPKIKPSLLDRVLGRRS